MGVVLTLSSSLLIACSSQPNGSENHDPFSMAGMDELPKEVQNSPVLVQQAYQFAFANPDILSQIPCYCGCGAMGHTSNYSCYVSAAGEDGKPLFDAHALECSICIDITQDTMRLLREGKGVGEIKTYVDQTYSKYGPSNMP
jgi:hypothetical protein